MILADKAALFVDGRYTIQAHDQVDGALFTIEHLVEKPPSAWIEANLRAGQKLGYDAWLHSSEGADRLAKACAAVGAMLVATTPNPIDTIWRDRPAPPHGAVVPHGLEYAGEAAADKLARIRAEIAKLKADALVVSDPHAVAWTFNIRGSDVAHTPMALAFAIIPAEGPARLYVEDDRVTAGAKAGARGPRRDPAAGGVRGRRRCARHRAPHRAARSGDRGVRHRAGDHRARRQGARAAPIRSRR